MRSVPGTAAASRRQRVAIPPGRDVTKEARTHSVQASFQSDRFVGKASNTGDSAVSCSTAGKARKPLQGQAAIDLIHGRGPRRNGSPAIPVSRMPAEPHMRPAKKTQDARQNRLAAAPESQSSPCHSRVLRRPAAAKATSSISTELHTADPGVLGDSPSSHSQRHPPISRLSDAVQASRRAARQGALTLPHGATHQSHDEDDFPPVQSLLSTVEPPMAFALPDMSEIAPEPEGGTETLPWELGLAGASPPATRPSSEEALEQEQPNTLAMAQRREVQEVATNAEAAAEGTLKRLGAALQKELLALDAQVGSTREAADQSALEVTRIEARADLAMSQANELSTSRKNLWQQVTHSERFLKQEMQEADTTQQTWQAGISVAAAELSVAKAQCKQAQKLADEERAALRFKEAARAAEERVARICEEKVQSMQKRNEEFASRAREEAQAAKRKAIAVQRKVSVEVEALRVDAGSKLKSLMEHVTDIEMALPEAIKSERANKEVQLQAAKDRFEEIQRSAAKTTQEFRSKATTTKRSMCERFDAVEESLVSAQAEEDQTVREALAAKKTLTNAKDRFQREVAIEFRRFKELAQNSKRNGIEQVRHARAEILQARREFDDADKDIEKRKLSQIEWSKMELRRAKEQASTIRDTAMRTKSMAQDILAKAESTLSAAEAHAVEVGQRATASTEKQLSDARERLASAEQSFEVNVRVAHSQMEKQAMMAEDELAHVKRKADNEIARLTAETNEEQQALASKVTNAGRAAELARDEAHASQTKVERAKDCLDEAENRFAQDMEQQRNDAIAQLHVVEEAKDMAIDNAQSQRAEAEQSVSDAQRIASERMSAAREAAEEAAHRSEELKNRIGRQAADFVGQCQTKIRRFSEKFAAEKANVREKVKESVISLEQKVSTAREEVALLKQDGETKVEEERKKYELEKNDAIRCENEVQAARQRAAITAQSAVNAESFVKARAEELAEMRAETKLAAQQEEAMLVDAQQLARKAVYQANILKVQRLREFKDDVVESEKNAMAAEELANSLEQKASLAKLSATERRQEAERAKETEVIAKENTATALERVAERSQNDIVYAAEAFRLLSQSGECKVEEMEDGPFVDVERKRRFDESVGEVTADVTPATSHAKRHRASLSCESPASTPCLPVGWGSLRASIKETLNATTTPKPRAQRRMAWSSDQIL